MENLIGFAQKNIVDMELFSFNRQVVTFLAKMDSFCTHHPQIIKVFRLVGRFTTFGGGWILVTFDVIGAAAFGKPIGLPQAGRRPSACGDLGRQTISHARHPLLSYEQSI